MSLESAITELAAAIRMLAGAQAGAVTVTADPVIPAETIATALKRGPGRPKKEPTEPAPQDAPPPPPAAVEKPAAAPAPVAGPDAAAGASPPTKDVVQKALIAVVQNLGKPACTELCMKYGKPNLSALPESVYADLLADATEALANAV